MEIRVSGHQIETGEALQAHVSDRMNAIADKYFSRAIGAHATFGKGPHDSFQCDIVAHVMQGLVLKGHGQAQDAHVAFEGAAERIEKQLRRYMRRLKDRNVNASVAAAAAASLDEIDDNASYTVFDAGSDEDDAGDAPAIIAETRVDIPTSSVSDAVMMLDLRNTNALLFVNSKTGSHNMVYRRDDGTIGWVEPR
ncbi:MAG: ribosome-associated translation inhibitor RaiA [Sphingopyxis sp.]|uniref:ribosome hibernation-promoting factor, HPF/YfiA family n=1 Tax=Sphingopyxis sp. TaxID=1908224 RepID=UPI001A454DB2|nr:ribosome-associated translation inhibitor RaiA [Sphingopyxis sp.]MBL9069933.1 ribosome-associated translation inhibitor RaiA [Sphingopyxis sp.]